MSRGILGACSLCDGDVVEFSCTRCGATPKRKVIEMERPATPLSREAALGTLMKSAQRAFRRQE